MPAGRLKGEVALPAAQNRKAAIPSESNKVKPEEGCRPKAT